MSKEKWPSITRVIDYGQVIDARTMSGHVVIGLRNAGETDPLAEIGIPRWVWDELKDAL